MAQESLMVNKKQFNTSISKMDDTNSKTLQCLCVIKGYHLFLRND